MEAIPFKPKRLSNDNFDAIGRFDGGCDARLFIALDWPVSIAAYIAATPEKRAEMMSSAAIVEKVATLLEAGRKAAKGQAEIHLAASFPTASPHMRACYLTGYAEAFHEHIAGFAAEFLAIPAKLETRP